MGWKNVSRPGARQAQAAGLSVRQVAAGHQVWVDEQTEAEFRDPALAETAVPQSVAALLETPLTKLDDALDSVEDLMVVVRAAARDPRSGAAPIYRRHLPADDDEEEVDATAELESLGIAGVVPDEEYEE